MSTEVFRRIGFCSIIFAAVASVFAFQTHASAPALIVLDAAKSGLGNTRSRQIPPGWELKVNAGHPDISFLDPGDPNAAIRFRSVKSSYGLERAVDIDPAQMPYLYWRWKVSQLPRGGDFRHASTDDQAAQVIVAFSDRRILTYLWDSTAPQGTMESASSIPLVHIFAIVCRSGGADINQWLQENRNIEADYQKAFGKPAPHVKGLRLQINSQHTGSSAESYFGEVAFHTAQS
ncbi:MAG TPA: DUF3047 domain-containing protein [Bryobacteraceae bacterium]|nr:DUF3047 domain-containing protein [Bryobacteraceae bacterium]